MDAREYYSRQDIVQKLLELGKSREVVGVFKDGSYSKRPNTIVYPADVEAMVRTGIVEFHNSIELWSNPLQIKSNYEDLRVGWDMVLDLDCDKFEHGRIAAKVLSDALKKHGINNFSIKYSGGTGFHLGIPWGSMPKQINYKKTEKMFPDLPRKIAAYLREHIRQDFAKALFSKFSPEKLSEELNIPLGEIMTDKGLDPFKIVEIDPILISPRHLFRMPYSLNRNTSLVSLPIKPENILEFEREQAKPEQVKPVLGFLDKYEEGECELLIGEALDWWNKHKKEEKKKEFIRERIDQKEAVNPENFPPCIKLISQGLKDGRKRAVFILMNYLASSKWTWERIEQYIVEWNKKNQPPLPDSYIRSQIKYNNSKDPKPPPNCPETVKPGGSKGYYESFGVCQPDETCSAIKNPLSYAFFATSANKEAPKTQKAK